MIVGNFFVSCMGNFFVPLLEHFLFPLEICSSLAHYFLHLEHFLPRAALKGPKRSFVVVIVVLVVGVESF